MADNSYENLTHSGLIKLPSKDDKNVSMTLDTWNGNTSICIFETQGSKPWKTGLSPRARIYIKELLAKMARDPKPCKEPIYLNEWVEKDNGKKGMEQVGCIAFGIDENYQPFIDIAHKALNNRHVFIIKGDAKYDFKETSFSEKDLVHAGLQWLIETLSTTVPMAERASSFKKSPQGGGGQRQGGGFNQGGGNRGGGYGGGGNRQGGYGGGGGGRQSNSFGSGPDVDSDIMV